MCHLNVSSGSNPSSLMFLGRSSSGLGPLPYKQVIREFESPPSHAVIPNGSRVPLGGGSNPQAASVRLLNAVVSQKRADIEIPRGMSNNVAEVQSH